MKLRTVRWFSRPRRQTRTANATMLDNIGPSLLRDRHNHRSQVHSTYYKYLTQATWTKYSYTVTLYLTSLPEELPRIVRIYRIFLETTIIGLHFVADNIGLSSLKFLWWAHKFCLGLCLQEWRFSRSRSSKVIDVGTNRKRVCDFLLVRNSNIGPVLHRFGDFAAFMCSWPQPPSILILEVFPLHQIVHVEVSKRISLKLFGGEIIFELFQPVWSRYLTVTDRQTDERTDGRTDGQSTCSLITALCLASRGKKRSIFSVMRKT